MFLLYPKGISDAWVLVLFSGLFAGVVDLIVTISLTRDLLGCCFAFLILFEPFRIFLIILPAQKGVYT